LARVIRAIIHPSHERRVRTNTPKARGWGSPSGVEGGEDTPPSSHTTREMAKGMSRSGRMDRERGVIG
jgi:hypothetical protein